MHATSMTAGLDVVVARADPGETARGYIHDFHMGALELIADRERGVLIGANLMPLTTNYRGHNERHTDSQ